MQCCYLERTACYGGHVNLACGKKHSGRSYLQNARRGRDTGRVLPLYGWVFTKLEAKCYVKVAIRTAIEQGEKLIFCHRR